MLRNLYCERLGIPVPRLEDVVARQRKTKLFYLMVVALVEHGGPMTIEEVAARLRTVGVTVPEGNLELSLRRAWHGSEPVHKYPDGRYALDLNSPDLDLILFSAGAKPPRSAPARPVEPVQPGDDVPLSEEELQTAFRDQNLRGLSTERQAAAVLDAVGQSLSIDDVEGYLFELTADRSRLVEHLVRRWRSTLIAADEDGRLSLNHAAVELSEVRRDVRKRARSARARKEELGHILGLELERARKHEREAQETARLRRAVLHVLPLTGCPYAASVIDITSCSIRSFVDQGLSLVTEALSEFDLLVGLHVRDAVHRLGLDPDRWRLIDLTPPLKSTRIDRVGRTVKVTPEAVIRSTTGISHPLGDAKKIAGYITCHQDTQLRRRLESDVKALYAMYRYGVLHGCVRWRWGFLDELLPVSWRLPGDSDLDDLIRGSIKLGVPIEVVVGSVPGWVEPWSRAQRGFVVGLSDEQLTLGWNDEEWTVNRFEIQAARVVE